MKKVLILANNDIGLYKFRKELLQKLVKQYEVYISLPNGDFVKDLETLGCKYIETPIDRRGTNLLTDLKLFLKYINIIRKIDPDIVLTYTIKPNIYGGIVCRMFNVPYIANMTGLGSAVENKGILQKFALALYKIALKKVKCLFFQNEENLKFITKNIKLNFNYRLIPGSGVNLKHFYLMEYPPEDIIHFLFIARVMKEKGIEQYLEAAECIRLKYPHTMFHILGFCEEGYADRLRKMQDMGIIKYHGMQNDVRVFHKTSHCIIHPTYYPEGMSNVLLESAACGRPIITTNRSGCKEIVDDYVNGYVVHQQSSQDLIEKIERFIVLHPNEKKKMGLAGRRKVEKEFDRQIVVNAYLKEIENVVG